MRKILFCILIFFATDARSNDEIKGSVIAVHDGNTLEVEGENNEYYRVILQGIDCPELKQKYGDKAKERLEEMILHKEVIIRIHGKDRLRNYIAIVLLGGEADIRIDLLIEGLAWTAEKNPLPELEFHRCKAAEKGKGLWIQDAPIAPWIYRRQQSMLHPKSR
jgi:micrococcal nuclease